MAANNNLPVTTIPPFADINQLPACAVGCAALYDANGGCVPPAIPTNSPAVYTSCFCNNGAVAAFSTGSTGVCDEACTDAAGLGSIQAWFQDICSVDAAANSPGNGLTTSNTAGSPTTTGVTISTGKAATNPKSGDWLSNHWQWVVFLVIMVVAVIGIWIGACIWRRRYLKKKDRQYSLGMKQSGSTSRPSWGPGMDPEHPEVGGQGVFPAQAPVAEKLASKPKKKWLVGDRT